MAKACALCGKTGQSGNRVSHANNKTRRTWEPNLQRVHAVVEGANKHIRVCTACIRGGKVTKA